MTTVKVLHAGGIGDYKQGDVVKDAPAGLVHIATKEVRNAADGELLAEIVEVTNDDDVIALRARAKELGIKGHHNMKSENLVAAVEEAERVAEEEAAKKAADEEAVRLAEEEAKKAASTGGN